jgi:hypothetical protein
MLKTYRISLVMLMPAGIMTKPTGGHVEYCKKSKRWKCFIVVDDINKHVGWGRTEKRALAIVRDSLERRS